MTLSKSIEDREYQKFLKQRGETVVKVSDPAVYKTPFNELSSVSRSVLFDSKANIPSLSKIRNNLITTGTGTAVINSGEVEIDCPSGSSVLLETAERGNYVPGYIAQAGIGLRLPDVTFTGSSYAEWGYFQGQSGIGFGKDSLGVYLFVKKDAAKEKIYQSSWNIDRLDGTGGANNPSEFNLDLSQGNIFQVDFAWYGYGPIQFNVQLKSSDSGIGSSTQLVHRFIPQDGVSVNQPNLHLSAFVQNDAQATFKSYVGGRQFSVYGDTTRQNRTTGEFVAGKAISTTWTPLITFKRKSASFEQISQTVNIKNASVASADNLVFGYFYDSTLTDATFENPSQHDPGETVLEVDTAATALTGGFMVGPKVPVIGGTGNQSQQESDDSFRFNLIEDRNITLAARTLSGTATVSLATFNLSEDW